MIQGYLKGIVFFLSMSSVLSGQIDDPVPGTIIPSGKVVYLEAHAIIPSSSDQAPFTRINLLREAPDQSGRLFVNDLRGKFWVVKDRIPQEYADLSEIFPAFIDSPGFGTGFGAFAFHPDFANNHKFYTAHTEAAGSRTADYVPLADNGITLQWVLTEWTANEAQADTWAGQHREILRFDFPYHIHGMQEIAFNPTASIGDEDYGLLYICMGDGGSSLNELPQNLGTTNSWLGTILRINPLGTDAENGQYGIPAGNPFFSAPDNASIREIYALGFRNPHRISWDPQNGNMYGGDIGEKNIEEINLIEAGRNYGWENREGTFLYDRSLSREDVYPLPENDDSLGFTYPVLQYDHDEGLAVVGGYVYRGMDIPELNGHYVFGDIPTGRLFHAAASALQQGQQTPVEWLATRGEDGFGTNLLALVGQSRADLRFGVDQQGEIFVLTKGDGHIRRLRGSLSTATANISANAIKLFPNPATTSFRIAAERVVDRVEVYDLLGQLLSSWSNVQAEESLPLPSLVPGIYTVSCLVGAQLYSSKLIIR